MGVTPRPGQLVDAFDMHAANQRWEDAIVVDARPGEVLVRFRRFTAAFSSWYPSEGPRAAELLAQWGTKVRPRQPYKPRTKAYWEGRVRGAAQFGRARGQAAAPSQEDDAPPVQPEGGQQQQAQAQQPPDARFIMYLTALRRRGMEVVPMGGDGNCLFRSVAHQVSAGRGEGGVGGRA